MNFTQTTFIAALLAGATATAAQAQSRNISEHRERAVLAQQTARALQSTQFAGGEAARSSPRIINGNYVFDELDAGTWEFAASLQRNGPPIPRGHFCGGVLVSPVLDKITGATGTKIDVVKSWDAGDPRPRVMLTAAHCVTENSGATTDMAGLEVVSGNTNLAAVGKVVQEVEKIIPHPGYNDETMANDIAILILSEAPDPVPDGANPRSIALPNRADVASYKSVTAAHAVLGWGTTENGFLSQFLMHVRVPYSDQAACLETYAGIGWNVHATSFCAGFVSGGFDSCQGDSGGVLFHRPTTGANSNQLADPVLTGIVSWGRGCGLPSFAGVYADVAAQRAWIESEVIEALK
jgi:secreted trypsin-like serine protease